MRTRSTWSIPLLGAALVYSFTLPGARAQDLPEGEGKALVEKICTACHGAEYFTNLRNSKQDWEDTVKSMVSKGAEGTATELETVLKYLVAHFGAKTNVNTATAKDLESGLELSSKEAEAIVKYRGDHGNFKEWQDLTKVPGVDAKKIEAKKDRLDF